jgi:hypothetical protein
MSNHFSAANLKFPGDDARLDLTDLFVFSAPDNPEQTVLIINVNPFMTGSEFHPDAVYRINIDNDGDAKADVAFTLVFSQPKDGKQTATVYHAVGKQARQPEPAGEAIIKMVPVGFDAGAKPVQAGPCRLFIGVRSDPFFADAEGALHGLKFTGADTFAGKNVLSIVLEVPNNLLGPGSRIGVWATVSVRRNGTLMQIDRAGHPSFNPILNAEDVKNAYNAGQPADDEANYLQPLVKLLQKNGYSKEEATAAAHSVFPDILPYDRTRPATYPNGRIPTDDVFDMRLAFLTHGKVTSDGAGPHGDLLAEFPYLGLPNRSDKLASGAAGLSGATPGR